LRDKLRISAVSLNLSVEITSEARCALQQLNDENIACIARVSMCCSDVTQFHLTIVMQRHVAAKSGSSQETGHAISAVKRRKNQGKLLFYWACQGAI
jgi:hypothetical protein